MDINSLIKVKNAQGTFDVIYPITKSENVIVGPGEKTLSTKLTEIDGAVASKIDNSKIGQANGVASLDGKGLIPVSQIPAAAKEVKVVDDISARDAIPEKFSGLSVYVKDATADSTVDKGGAYYIYDGSAWIKTAESESMDVVVDFANIANKPTTLDGYGITDAVKASEKVTVANAGNAGKILVLNDAGKLDVDVTGNAASATKLAIARNISIGGDATGSASFDGTDDATITLALADVVQAGTYTKVTVDKKGRVTGHSTLSAADIPNLDYSKITTGKPTTLAGYGITDAVMVRDQDQTMTGRLTLTKGPTADSHAATKAYVDSVVQGLDIKESVRVATTENIALSGLQTIQEVALAKGDRVLVMGQTDKTQNGIYVASEEGWTRAIDANTDDKVHPGMFTFVEEGNNADAGFVLATNGAIKLGTTELEFSQFSGAGQIAAGTGLVKKGNTLSLAASGASAGTYTKVTIDEYGRVVEGVSTTITEADITGNISWAKLSGAPTSAVKDIDDAVSKRHTHANAVHLDKIGEANGKMTYDGNAVALAKDCVFTHVGSEENSQLSTGGLWFQIKAQ